MFLAMYDERDGVLYLNCGDWVESMSALVEDSDGTLRIVGR
jgi:UDP-2,3-diacylglucosamine pyrophosphatase LpxH